MSVALKKEEYQKAQKDLEKVKKSIVDLTEKKKKISLELDGLKKEKNEHDRIRENLFESFVLGEIGNSKLEELKKKSQEISERLDDQSEVLMAVKAALLKAEKAIPEYDSKIFNLKNAVWGAIKSQEIAKVKSLLGSDASKNSLIRAYCAALQGGGAAIQAYIPTSLGYSFGNDEFSRVKKIIAAENGLEN